MVKVTRVVENIDEKTKTRWDRQRWRDDNVSSLPQSFVFKEHGRDGSIYYREGDRIAEIPYEISGNPKFDILVAIEGTEHWILPTRDPVPLSIREQIVSSLREWLSKQGVRAKIGEDPNQG